MPHTTRAKSAGLDCLLAPSEFQKGRMSDVKNSLMNKIKVVSPTATVIDAWRMSAYNFNSFTGVLVSVKIMPSKFQKLHYGNEIVNKYSGQYHTYIFSLHVLARYVQSGGEDAELASQTAYNTSNSLVTYLRTHNTDELYGVIDTLQITARESDPAGAAVGGAHMARIIIEGLILAERPWRKSAR